MGKLITHNFSSGNAPYQLEAILISQGNDIVVSVGGGAVPHVGAVATGEPRLSLRNDGTMAATASVICFSGHKDDLFAREAALRLAATGKCNAVVTVGIHVEELTNDIMESIEANFYDLLEQIEAYLVSD